MHNYWFVVLLAVGLFACDGNEEVIDDGLPILGEKGLVDGKEVDHTIPPFSFMDQDSMMVTKETMKDKVYVVDFFFTSCPTICPKMTKQMKRMYDYFEAHPNVAFLSHSIDTRRDSIPRLRAYAENIGINDAKQWHFVTGGKDEIFEMSDEYFIVALEDGQAAGGFDHSGQFVIVDPEGRVRSFADGTNPEEVDRLMKDVEKLLEEYGYPIKLEETEVG